MTNLGPDGIEVPQSLENHQTTQIHSQTMELLPTFDEVNSVIVADLTAAREDSRQHVRNDVPNVVELDTPIENRPNRNLISKKFLCNICHSPFTNRYRRDHHNREQHSIGKTSYKCLFCPEQLGDVYFKSSFALTNHQRNVHLSGPVEGILPTSTGNGMDVSRNSSNIANPSTCWKDTSALNTNSALALNPTSASDPVLSHQAKPARRPKPKFNCRICRSPFAKPERRKKHEETQHNGSKKYRCTDCLKELGNIYFSSHQGLMQHRYVVHQKRGANELLMCKFCLSPFKEQYSLGRHEGVQHGAKNHLCTQCPEELGQVYFSSIQGLRIHQNIRHMRNPLVTGGRNRNAQTGFPHDGTTDSVSKQFRCKWSTCQHICATKLDLKNHVARKHFSEAVWKCRVTNCSKFCSTKYDRNVHEHMVHERWK